jgi:hypothetical protein
VPDNLYYDYLGFLPGGMDSGRLPRILSPQQVAFAFNTTFRGEFATDRPKVRKVTLEYGEDAELQAAFEQGLYQGSAYFKPDSGPQVLIASVSGRYFQFTPDTLGNATVIERSIPGDTNSPTQPQAWFWQAESWLIGTNGQQLPLFLDANTIRRSDGPAQLLGVTSANFTSPAVNSNVTLTLAANYEGPLNAIVNIGNFGNYLVVAVGTPPPSGVGYAAFLSNVNATPGATVSVGTPVIIPAVSNIITTTNGSFTVPTNSTSEITIAFTNASTIDIGETVTIASRNYLITNTVGAFPNSRRVKCQDPNTSGTPISVPTGTTVYNPNITPSPDVTVGTVAVAFTVPAVSSPVTAQLSTLWTGPVATIVTVNGKTYQLSPAPQDSTPSTTIIVKNLTDTPSQTRTAPLNLLTIPELPIGRMGVYGLGRNWMSLIDGISFTASDLVGESSGSSAYNFRDAVLKVTKNGALFNGKPFRVPNAGETIQGMSFIAQLDVALGQGPLQVFTDGNVFACQAPVDSNTWANLTTPILAESLKGSGGISHESLVNSNADIFFRSPDGALRSFKIARLDYDKWGNTPISHEMERVIRQENVSLANRCSGVEFNNRLLQVCHPIQGEQGVYHQGVMVINFDSISSLAGKSPSIYDGLWTGLQIFRIIKGKFFGIDRCFAFCFNSVDSKIELWEFLPDNAVFYDETDVPVIWGLESADMFRGRNQELIEVFKGLEDGELSVDDVRGEVEISVFYKPDQYPGWVLWQNWTVKNDMLQPNSQPGYFPRMGLGKPKDTNKNDLTQTPTRFGYTFQLRIVIQGHCRFLGARFAASYQPQPKFKAPSCEPITTAIQLAPIDDFLIYNLNAGVQAMPQ